MNSIEESFNKAYQETKSIKLVSSENVISDEDSAKEEEIFRKVKRKRKRRRTQSSKQIKPKKSASTFTVRHVVPTTSVTPNAYPEILSVDSEFHLDTSSNELIVAETNFFNSRNKDEWQKSNDGHVRPFDFPFVRALIQTDPSETFDIHQFNDRERLRANIETVTREYEEEFLREPIGSERKCVLDSACEGLKIMMARDKAFILREFLLPSEKREMDASSKCRPERRLCLMCKRKEIARAWTNIRSDGKGMREDCILQDYRNLVGVKGEYNLRDCLVSSRHTYEGIVDPLVLHMRSGYRIVEKNGVRYYQQWSYGYPKTTQPFLFQALSN